MSLDRFNRSTATRCSTLQRTAAHCSALPDTAAHWSTLQNTSTYCYTLRQNTATRITSNVWFVDDTTHSKGPYLASVVQSVAVCCSVRVPRRGEFPYPTKCLHKLECVCVCRCERECVRVCLCERECVCVRPSLFPRRAV